MSNGARMQVRGKSGGARLTAQDLVSPLRGIESLIAQLGDARSPTDQDTLIAALRAAAAHVRSVATAFAKPGDYSASAAAVAEAVRFFAVAARARCQSRGRPFRQDVSPACEAMMVRDGTRLRQVLEHLLDEVLAREGVREVVLAVHPAQDGDSAIVRIEARGMKDGTSLAGAARLAADFGGVCASDRDGVSVTFPIAHRAAVEAPFSAAETFAPAILLVDDGSSSHRSIRTVLQSLGYVVDSVATLEEAVTSLQDRVFAALFADMGAAGSGAWQIVNSLRESGAELPLIALAAPGEQRKLAVPGAQAVIETPCTVHDMRQCLVQIGLLDPMMRQVSAA